MSVISLDWQFDLDGYLFGPGTDVTVVECEPNGAETRDQDQPSGFGDWRVFGTDRVTPPTWNFELAIRERTADDALAVLAPLQQAMDPASRVTPQATVPLRYQLGGRQRVQFGRPRRFTPVLTDLVFGRIAVAADFTLAHLGSFDDTVQSSPTLTLGVSDLGSSGFSFPVTFPFLWGGSEADPHHTTVTVGGSRETFLTATFTGGAEIVTDPYLIIDGQVLQFSGTLAPGEVVQAFGSPWDLRVSRLDGTSPSLTLAAGSRLASLTVAPGSHEVTFGGIDGSGSATCVVSWRPAYPSI